MSLTNYEGVQIIVRPVQDGNTYELVVENHGDSELWHLLFSTYEILGPSAFDLDDTHMPDSLTNEEPGQIHCLPPGGSVSLVRKKWGTLARYHGPASGVILVKFAPREGEERSAALRAVFTIPGALSLSSTQSVSPFAERFPNAFRLGQAFGSLINRCRTKHVVNR